MSHPVALSHVRYLVSEFEPLLRFYRDVLGLKVAVDVPGVYVELDTRRRDGSRSIAPI